MLASTGAWGCVHFTPMYGRAGASPSPLALALASQGQGQGLGTVAQNLLTPSPSVVLRTKARLCFALGEHP